MRKRKNGVDEWVGLLVLAIFPIYLVIKIPWLIIVVALIAFLCFLPKIIERNKKAKTRKIEYIGITSRPEHCNLSAKELSAMVELELQMIDNMKGMDFEAYVAEILKYNGYNHVTQTKISGDYGIDVIAYKDEKMYAFQCKRFANKLGLKPIQEAFAGKQHYNADEAVVITNSDFTKAAMQLASETVIYCDRHQLSLLIENYVLASKCYK